MIRVLLGLVSCFHWNELAPRAGQVRNNGTRFSHHMDSRLRGNELAPRSYPAGTQRGVSLPCGFPFSQE